MSTKKHLLHNGLKRPQRLPLPIHKAPNEWQKWYSIPNNYMVYFLDLGIWINACRG
jgi:hypothetical protein